MRSIKSGLLTCFLSSLVGVGAVVGCSATGDTGDIDEVGVDAGPSQGQGNTLPPSNPDDDDEPGSGTDAGKKDAGKDAGKTDAGKDAGPPAPDPGDPCTTPNQLIKRTCGKCGFQEALCIANDSGTGGTVSDYGLCQNEIGQCVPDETAACGNCGTRTCSNSCNWNTCTGQGECPAGSTSYSTATCSTPNTFISRTCDNTCKWGAYTTTCESPQLSVPATVGQVASGTWALTTSQQAKKPSGFSTVTCPATSLGVASPYFAVPVTNSTNKAAVVQIYNSGTPALDTLLAVYDRSTVPTTDDELKACVKAADTCSTLSDVCGNATSGGSSYDWAGVDDITIPAGGTVMVVTSGYSVNEVGDFTLNVKTKSLN